jgi:hypothetical protein
VSESETTGGVELARFAIEEGIRALQLQEAEAARIRDRVVTLVGLVAAGSSFLVGAALDESTRGWRFHGPLLLGTVLFVVLMLQGWRVLRPTRSWASKVSSEVIVEDFAPLPLREGWALLARFYGKAQLDNEAVLDGLRAGLQRALLLAGGVTVTWMALIWLVAA